MTKLLHSVSEKTINIYNNLFSYYPNTNHLLVVKITKPERNLIKGLLLNLFEKFIASVDNEQS